jgi:hypothetical protein
MKPSTIDKIAWFTVALIGVIIIAGLILLSWGFVEIIQWITS